MCDQDILELPEKGNIRLGLSGDKKCIAVLFVSFGHQYVFLTTSVGEDVERLESLHTVGGNAEWPCPYRQQYRGPQKIKSRTAT